MSEQPGHNQMSHDAADHDASDHDTAEHDDRLPQFEQVLIDEQHQFIYNLAEEFDLIQHTDVTEVLQSTQIIRVEEDSDASDSSPTSSTSGSDEETEERSDSQYSSDEEIEEQKTSMDDEGNKEKPEKEPEKIIIPNEEYLRENLMLLKKTLSDTAVKAEDCKSRHMEAQVELDLNQLAMANIVNWIQEKLKGNDPSQTPLKNLLDRIRESMLVFYEVKDGGRWPATVKSIEALFQHVYEL